MADQDNVVNQDDLLQRLRQQNVLIAPPSTATPAIKSVQVHYHAPDLGKADVSGVRPNMAPLGGSRSGMSLACAAFTSTTFLLDLRLRFAMRGLLINQSEFSEVIIRASYGRNIPCVY
jgi:hypothetical protein